MIKKIAIAIIHGAGIHRQSEKALDSMMAMQARLEASFKEKTGHNPLKFELIYWDEKSRLQKRQDKLHKTLEENGVDFGPLPDIKGSIRQYVYDRLGDVAAYQPVNDEKLKTRSTYSIVHQTVAKSLAKLSKKAGNDARLCIIAHSLGSVIASNYIYDLQKRTVKPALIPPPVKEIMGSTLLERGKTLHCLFTMGSPMALWWLRTGNLGKPIKVPTWINFFDDSDVVAYPLENLLVQKNGKRIVQDMQVETGWTLTAHSGYWENEKVIDVIVNELVKVWKSANDQP